MRSFVMRLNSRTVNSAFAAVFVICLLGALFPPFYLAASGIRTPVLGIPFAIAYWIIDTLVLGFGLWALYVVERVRGELDDEDAEAITPSLEVLP